MFSEGPDSTVKAATEMVYIVNGCRPTISTALPEVVILTLSRSELNGDVRTE